MSRIALRLRTLILLFNVEAAMKLLRLLRLSSSIQMWISLAVLMGFGMDVASLSAQEKAETPAAEVKAITEEEAVEFADALTEVANIGDFVGSNKLIDWNSILEKAVAKPESEKLEQARADFKRTVTREVGGSQGVVAQIHGTIRQGGSYKCLRASVTDQRPFLMFRLKMPAGRGVNYHQYFLVRNAAGKIVASDMYVFLTAELMSDTLHRSWLPLATQVLKKNSPEGADDIEPLVAQLASVTKIVELNAQKQFQESLKIYRGLPESLRKDKNVMLFALLASQGTSEEEYSQIIQDFRKYHPNDVAVDFLLIDGYTLLKQYDAAIDCVNRTNKQVGGDAMLLTMRASAQLLAKRIPDAKASLKEAMQLEPELYEAYAAGLDVSLAEGNFEDTANLLRILQNKFGIQFSDLREAPPFSEFVKSPEYRKWAETQKNQGKK